MIEENSKKNIFDVATYLTIGGVILFQMGYVYWQTYYTILNIHFSFIEMPLENYIASTWTFFFVNIIGLIFVFSHVYKDNSDFLETNSTFVVTCIFIILLMFNFGVGDVLLYINFGLFGLLLTLQLYAIKLKVKTIKKNIYIKYLLIIFYFIGLIVYNVRAKNDALTFIKEFKKNDIEITFNDTSKASGKFISFMNNKYFILIKNKKGKIETVVLNDTEIHHTRFLNNAN